MDIQITNIEGLYIVKINQFDDERGYFVETFRHDIFQEKIRINYQIKQMSQAFNKKRGTLRGMHFQKDPHSEIKLVKCTNGAIFDVALDLRKDSKTYLKWFGIELNESNNTLLFIPKGCAHGYQTLKDNTLVQYCIDEIYHPETSTGVRWNDPAFGIKWPLPNPILSPKDLSWPLM